MITITRSLARKVRAVFRRAGLKPRGSLAPPVAFSAGPDGLRIRAMAPDVALEYHTPGEYPAEELTVTLEFLDDCQGKQDEPVTLEPGKQKKTIVRWRDSGIPQVVEYDAQPIKKPFPEVSATLMAVDSTFWPALRDAAECTDQSPTRYALNNIQLRGESGQVFAADGRQIYVHDGFQFPWTGDVLVPAIGVLGCADLAGDSAVQIGKTEQALMLRIGNWTLVLTIDGVGRFPHLEEIATRAESGTSLLRLTAGDAEFLEGALPRLLREGSEFQAVTLDLNGQAILQAQAAADAPRTEVLLSNATTAGPPIRIAMDRCYLARALKLGLTELRLTDPNQPLLAADERRKYIWAPISLNEAKSRATDVIRIETPPAGADPSAANGAAAGNGPTRTNGQVRRAGARKTGRPATAGAIEQSVALRNALRESVTKANELIRTLKRQRQQSRLVQSTLASLKQLQQAG